MSFSVEIIAVGKMKSSTGFATLFYDYARRMQGKVKVTELEGKNNVDEIKNIEERLSPNAPLIIMDERGKTIPSLELAKKIEDFQLYQPGTIQCVIGGADGLNDNIRNRASLLMSFGRQTWPHMLARVMLMEQLYRAQQIIAKHPYHRE